MKKSKEIKENQKDNLNIASSEISDETSEEKTGWWS